MNSYEMRQEEREEVSKYIGKAGTMRVIDSLVDLRDRFGQVAQVMFVDRRVEFEGMEAERERAIVKFLAVKDYHWVQALLQGHALDCPHLQEALDNLRNAVVIEDQPQPEVDILSLTKEFINDPTKR